MSIKELTCKIEKASTQRSHKARVRMLKNAHIIDKDGYFPVRYFSDETVKKDRAFGKAILA